MHSAERTSQRSCNGDFLAVGCHQEVEEDYQESQWIADDCAASRVISVEGKHITSSGINRDAQIVAERLQEHYQISERPNPKVS